MKYMVRLADLPDWDRKNKLDRVKDLTGFDARPWVQPPPLEKCRIAIITTAGIHRRSDRPFGPQATDYRIIPGNTAASQEKSFQALSATSVVPRAVLMDLLK
jgi:D-proline reductase (dithiol) PrdB